MQLTFELDQLEQLSVLVLPQEIPQISFVSFQTSPVPLIEITL